MTGLEKSLFELIRRTAVHLPLDVVEALEAASRAENEGTSGALVLEVIRENVEIARAQELPVSPETSSVQFYASLPSKLDTGSFQQAAEAAVAEATKQGYLQSGRVDPVTEKPYKTNVGPGSPAIHYTPTEDSFEVRLVLKGSGAESAGAQYSLPDDRISGSRDLSGVRRAVLDSVIQALGNGSGPGVLGVGVGGDRASGYALAHRQLLRPLGDRNSTQALAKLEKRILEDANSLGIGPMGFGGKSTLLGVKIAAESRPTSSCYVSISYIGWACRRQGVRLSAKGDIESWLYPDTTTGGFKARPKKSVAAKVTPERVAKKASTKKAPAKKAVTQKPASKKTATASKAPTKKATAEPQKKTAKKKTKTTAKKTKKAT